MAFLIFPRRAVEFIPPVLVHTFLSFTPFYLSFLACHLPIAAKAQLYIFFFLKTHDIRFYLLIFLWQDSFFELDTLGREGQRRARGREGDGLGGDI